MASDFSYDPVTAIDESRATGEIAAIFADIRRTMDIPLVTSIWRGLAGMSDSLPEVWRLTKPVFESGLPDAALSRLIRSVDLPYPEPLTPTQLACVGIGATDVQDIRTIVAAYNRSNGLNMVALAALVTTAEPAAPDVSHAVARRKWPVLRPLRMRDEIDDETWDMIRQVNAFGAPGMDAAVATLWRHLAHWPGLLALVHSALAPLQSRGVLAEANARAVNLGMKEGAAMAHLRAQRLELPKQAQDTIESYVNSPTQVARMVVIGHVLEKWLS